MLVNRATIITISIDRSIVSHLQQALYWVVHCYERLVDKRGLGVSVPKAKIFDWNDDTTNVLHLFLRYQSRIQLVLVAVSLLSLST